MSPKSGRPGLRCAVLLPLAVAGCSFGTHGLSASQADTADSGTASGTTGAPTTGTTDDGTASGSMGSTGSTGGETDPCMGDTDLPEGCDFAVDPAVIDVWPDHCVGPGVDLTMLIDAGVIGPGTADEISCYFESAEGTDDPLLGAVGHGRIPEGVDVDGDCEIVGTPNTSLYYGTHVWTMTFEHLEAGVRAYVPYCVQQMTPKGPYEVHVDDSGDDVTFAPGYTQMASSSISFGTETEPRAYVTDPCPENFCFYSYYFSYNVFNPAEGPISAEPSVKIQSGGFEHALRVSYDVVPEELQDRFWVANIAWTYCLHGSNALNQVDAEEEFQEKCGSKDIAELNGGGNLEYDLIVRPP